jgi:hypothetical protein
MAPSVDSAPLEQLLFGHSIPRRNALVVLRIASAVQIDVGTILKEVVQCRLLLLESRNAALSSWVLASVPSFVSSLALLISWNHLEV